MPDAFDDDRERTRKSVDIVDLVRSYISLQRKGSSFVGICPWHSDSNPSLTVTPARQSWRCWVCNLGGDIFSFVMQIEGIDFLEAKRMLAERAGIDLSDGGRSASHDKSSLFEIVQWAENRFHDMLLHGAEAEPAREYLAERGINSKSVERYRIGFSPRSWTWLQGLGQQCQISTESLIEAGLVGRNEQRGSCCDRFRGRLIFPIRNFQARPIAFGGRILTRWVDDGAKYVNPPETRLFQKRYQLYGLSEVRDEIIKTRAVTVMEGYTDVVMASQLGVKDAVAVLGTALGVGHIRFLGRFVDRVTLVLDGDEACRKRANDVLSLFITHNLDLRVLTLPDGLDPCDFIAQHGVEEFNRLRSTAPDALEHKIRLELAGIDPLQDTQRAIIALGNILTLIALLPLGDSEQKVKVVLLLGRLARTFQLQESDIRNRLTGIRNRRQTKQWLGEAVNDIPQRTKIPSNERELIEILLLAPELIELVIEMVELDYFVHAGCREIYQLMLDLHSQGLTTGFENIRHRLETIEGQSLLVAIDEEARVKAETALSPAERWETLDAMMREESSRSDEAEKRKALSPGLDDSEKMDILTSLADSIRARMTPVDPKDVFGIELERLPDDGLVFVGGDCSSTWMLAAYRRGIFPWPHLDHRDADGNAYHQLAWYCPNPRWVLTPQSLHIPRRLARRLRRREFKFSVNRRFEECVRLVARSEQTEETWLSPELELGYRRLMKQGHALSLEVWQDGELVGTVLAVVVGGFASAESMFYTRRDASKAGLVTMVQLLARAGYQMIDVQQPSAHCCQLGAFSLTRNQFLIQHAEAVEQKVRDLGDFSL